MRILFVFVFFSLLAALVFSAGYELYEAAKNDHLETVQNFLEERSGEFTDGMLNLAISAANSDLISLEFARFINERKGYLRGTILEYAAGKGHLETVKYLLLHESSGKFSDFVLNSAISNARTDEIGLVVACFMIDRKRGIVNNETLINVAKNGHLETVKYLLLHESSGKFSDFHLNSAISNARTDGISLEVARFIIDRRGIVDDETLINIAYKGRLETVKYILNARPEEFSDRTLNAAIVSARTDEISLVVARCINRRKGIVNDGCLINVTTKGHLKTLRCLLFDGPVEFSDVQLDSLSAEARNDEIRDLIAERT